MSCKVVEIDQTLAGCPITLGFPDENGQPVAIDAGLLDVDPTTLIEGATYKLAFTPYSPPQASESGPAAQTGTGGSTAA